MIKNTMQKIKNLIIFGLLLYSITTHAEVQQFEPSLPQFYNSVAERKANNQFYYLGEAKFKNGVSIPFYGVTAENPADGDGERLIKKYEKCTAKNCDFDFKLDATQAKQLKLIALPSIGLTLVLREWQEIQSNAGGNGTGYALMMSKDHQQAIELSDSALCVGCGLRPATLYFPNLLPQSIENEFGGYKDSKKRLTLVHPNKNMAYFSYQIPKLSYATHGIAQYQDEEFFNFKEIHVTLNESQTSLATTILNFYKFTH